MPSNFIEITLRHGCSPVNLLHIFRTDAAKLSGAVRNLSRNIKKYTRFFSLGLVEELKSIHSIRKEPLNEDEIQVQHFCINLEKILRYGLRGMYLVCFPIK